MTSYTYPTNSVIPPNQDQASFQNYSGYPNQSSDNSWNQPNAYGQQSGRFSNYDQQNNSCKLFEMFHFR